MMHVKGWASLGRCFDPEDFGYCSALKRSEQIDPNGMGLIGGIGTPVLSLSLSILSSLPFGTLLLKYDKVQQ